MGELIVESKGPVQRTPAGSGQTEENSDREMQDCLERLKVWQVENLMAPHGMDRFAKDIHPGKKASDVAAGSSGGGIASKLSPEIFMSTIMCVSA